MTTGSSAHVLPLGPSAATDLSPAATTTTGFVRRTSHLEQHPRWPEGELGWAFDSIEVVGACRDARFDADGTLIGDEVASIALEAGADWALQRLSLDPPLPGASDLVGAHTRRGFRKLVEEAVPEGRGTPSRFLLQDLPTLAVIFHYPILRAMHAAGVPAREVSPPSSLPRIVDVCVGWAAEHTAAAVVAAGEDRDPRPLPVGPDPTVAWHDSGAQAPGSIRRARRFDVWRDGDEVVVDAGYRDTYGEPTGGIGVIHEYGLGAVFDADLRLLRVVARPQVLPFPECPMAVDNIDVLHGVAAADLPTAIRERLDGTRGCTHLNDLMAALVDVPHLVAVLDATPA